MPVTIYDVAKKAGVGIGTVSRVINNSPLAVSFHLLRDIFFLSYCRGFSKNSWNMNML